MKKIVGVLAGSLLLVTACASVAQAKEDSPWKDVGKKHSLVVTMCDHGNRVYLGSGNYANNIALAVVPQDPTCN